MTTRQAAIRSNLNAQCVYAARYHAEAYYEMMQDFPVEEMEYPDPEHAWEEALGAKETDDFDDCDWPLIPTKMQPAFKAAYLLSLALLETGGRDALNAVFN